MAKKAELLEQAHKLNLDVTEKNTIAEIEAAIAGASDTSEEVKEEKTEKVAKAGKRSAKAIKEAEEKAEKEEHKEKVASGEVSEGSRKGPKPVTRSRLERRSKKYKEAHKLIEVDKVYALKEAVELVPRLNTAKFSGSAELHIKLGVDPKHADQNIRGTVILPNGTGNTKKVAVFAPADLHKAAKDAGADIVGEETLLEQLDKEVIDFDVLISTPQLMIKLSKYARLLGPKGLMPNPKTGTVAADVAKAVTEAKAGKVEYRVDKQGIVHLGIGKLDFTTDKLVENATTVLKAIKEAKPASVKGEYIQTITLAPTMGPGVKIERV